MSIGNCILCFAEDVKLFEIKDTYLQFAYEEISDSKIKEDTHCLCYICYARLKQCYVLFQQPFNLQKCPQDNRNKMECVNQTLVQLSNQNVQNFSIPSRCVAVKQEYAKEETSDDNNEEIMKNKPLCLKYETVEEASVSSLCSNELTQDKSVLQIKKDKSDLKENGIEMKSSNFKIEETNILYNHRLKNEMKVSDSDSKTHEKMYNVDKPYCCDICNMKFGDGATLKTHKITHTGEKPYSCEICNRNFNKKCTLKIHKRIHTDERPYSCDICNRKFRETGAFKRHYRIHTGDKPYSCQFCDSKFRNSTSLKTHTRIHTGEKPYFCNICNKKFASNGPLIIHRRTHTGEKPYSCNICKKQFICGFELNIHKNVHSGNKPYSCDVCDMKFSRPDTAKAHKRIHTGDRPYSCDICNKKFRHRSSLNPHKMTHTGDKPYGCNFCPKKYSQKSYLKLHSKKHLDDINLNPSTVEQRIPSMNAKTADPIEDTAEFYHVLL